MYFAPRETVFYFSHWLQQLVPKYMTAYFSDSVISLQDALMQCPAQDSSSLSSRRIESPTPSTGETFAHFTVLI